MRYIKYLFIDAKMEICSLVLTVKSSEHKSEEKLLSFSQKVCDTGRQMKEYFE